MGSGLQLILMFLVYGFEIAEELEPFQWVLEWLRRECTNLDVKFSKLPF